MPVFHSGQAIPQEAATCQGVVNTALSSGTPPPPKDFHLWQRTLYSLDPQGLPEH